MIDLRNLRMPFGSWCVRTRSRAQAAWLTRVRGWRTYRVEYEALVGENGRAWRMFTILAPDHVAAEHGAKATALKDYPGAEVRIQVEETTAPPRFFWPATR